MERQLKANNHSNFLKNRFLRSIFITGVLLALTLPVAYVVLIHPAFTDLLIADKVDDALSIAKHLSSYVSSQSANVEQNHLPVNFLNQAVEHKNDFGLKKLKVFAKSGEVIFSTDANDVGTINRERYLHEVIEKGKPYAHVVTRHNESLEGQTMSADVVETYVPLTRDDSAIGAFEIYYDITRRKDQLDNLLLRSSGILTILAGGLLFLVIILLFKEHRTIAQRERAEEQVRRAHDELERRVKDRTADLLEANERLSQEIEERKRIEEELRGSEKKYRSLINEASDAIVLSDTEGNVLDTNKKALELFGYARDELLYKHVTELHPEEDLQKTLTAFKEVVQSGTGFLNDTKILRNDGQAVPVDITGSVIQYGDHKVVQGFFRDITERKLAEAAIRKAEEQYRLLVKNLPSIVYRGYKDWSVDFFDKNKIESALGYNLEDFTSRKIKWSEVIVEEDLERASSEFVQALRGDKSYVREYRIKTKGGKILWIQDRGQIVCDQTGEIEYLSGVFFDITDHKHTDEALRRSEKELRFLSAELLNAQERERARLARELHDGVGQALSTMKVRIETLAKIGRSDESQLRVEELENLVPMIRQTIEEVRNTCMDLRPSTLDSLGIVPTIDWFSREFQTTYPHMQIEKEIDIQETEVPDPLKTVIYRIVQEAFNNAGKHSGTQMMRVSLVKKNGEIRLAVKDNGGGFDPEDLLSADTAERGFGLTSMKERTELSGGSFSIESGIGKGTTIRATWKV
ncbi:MAG: PAS domain S-box protein [Deltaproteobacteria bacterium]|nr:PAS domain S-box protein [Deltaproteobacteria bacterium]